MKNARIPEVFGAYTGTPFVSARTMNSTVTPSRTAFSFQAPEAFTCTEIGFRQSSVTGTPGVLRFGLQGIDTNGKPDGTWLATVSGGAGTAYVDYSSWSTANNTKFVIVTLPTGGVSLTRGQVVYLVAQCQSGTWDASNNLSMTYEWVQGQRELRSRAITFETSLQSQTRPAPFLLRSSTTTYGYPLETMANIASIHQGTTPDEIGMAFTMPSSYSLSYKVRGVVFNIQKNQNQSVKFILYQGTTLLQDVTWNFNWSGSNDYGMHEIYFDESSLSTLSSGTEYVLSIQPIGTSTTQGVTYSTSPADTDLSALSDWTLKYYSRTDLGSWSQTTGRLPQMQLIIETVSSTSSGGLIVHPGMGGGMRG